MIGMSVLALFVVFAGIVLAGTLFVVVCKAVFWLLLLPLRLLLGLLLLPLLLIKVVVGGLVFLIVGPIALVGALIAAVAIGAAVLTPLLPLLVLGLVIWLIARADNRPAPLTRT